MKSTVNLRLRILVGTGAGRVLASSLNEMRSTALYGFKEKKCRFLLKCLES